MGMSSPTTKAEAREQIAKLQGEIERKKADLAHYKSYATKGSYRDSQIANMNMDIANKKAKIAELRAKIPSLP